MNANQLIELMNRAPFDPFELHLNDGSVVRVEQPYQIATRPSSATCTIYDEEDRMRFVAYRNIAQIVTRSAE